MSYDASQDQYSGDELAKGQSGQPGQPNVQLSGGGGGFAGQGATSQGQQGGPQQPSSSGAWTNLNSYLSANSDQSGAVGQGIANTVGSQASQAQGDLGTLQNNFQNQTPYQNLNNTTTSQVDQAFANPSQYSAQGSDTTTPENYLNNNWGAAASDLSTYAPTSGPSWGSVGSEYQNVGSGLQNTQTESGRGTLLQNQYSGKGVGYNQGEQNFDQLLLEQNPGNQQALNSVYNQYAPGVMPGSGSTLSADQQSAMTGSQNYANQEAGKATGFQNQAIGDLNSQISGLGYNLRGETSADSAALQGQYSQLVNDLTNRSVTGQEGAQLGIDPSQATYDLTGGDIASNLSALTNNYAGPQGANYAATEQDWKNYGGLQNLVTGMKDNGSQVSALGGVGLTGNQAQQDQAPNVPYTFNAGGLTSMEGTRASSYQNALQALNAQNPAYSGYYNVLNNAHDANSLSPNTGASGSIGLSIQNYQNQLAGLNQQHGIGNTLAGNAPSPVAASIAQSPAAQSGSAPVPVSTGAALNGYTPSYSAFPALTAAIGGTPAPQNVDAAGTPVPAKATITRPRYV